MVGSKPSQVDFSAKSLIRGCWLNQVAIDFFYSSSGYGTTPGSSNVSSQCSSQVCETLACKSTMSDHLFTRRGSINLQLHILQLSSKQCTSNSSLTSLCIKSTSTNEILQKCFLRHFSSNDSNPSLVDLEEGRRSPSLRPRSRSLR